MLAHAQVGVLEPDATRHGLGHLAEQVALAAQPLEVIGHLLGRLTHVAEVGEEKPQLGADHAHAVRAGVAGEVADVDELGDDQRVELAVRDQLREAIGPAHAAALNASRNSSSPSR